MRWICKNSVHEFLNWSGITILSVTTLNIIINNNLKIWQITDNLSHCQIKSLVNNICFTTKPNIGKQLIRLRGVKLQLPYYVIISQNLCYANRVSSTELASVKMIFIDIVYNGRPCNRWWFHKLPVKSLTYLNFITIYYMIKMVEGLYKVVYKKQAGVEKAP